MPEQPLVSIIIPTFNRAHLIGETLDSVLAQTYHNWECIVVDDGSTDGTEALLHNYIENDNRFQYHKRPDTYLSGGNASRNYGFEMSRGDFIQWFDDDDIMLPKFLEVKMNLFTESVVLVICNGYKVDNKLDNSELSELKQTTSLFKDYALRKARILTPSVLFRTSFLENKNLYSVNLLRGQETELFLRLFYNLDRNFYRIISEPLFMYREHDNSKTKQGKSYPANFIEGQAVIFIRTLKMGVELNDKEIVLYYYRFLLQYFFIGLKANDKTNCQFILKGILDNLGSISFRFKVELKLLGIIFSNILKSPPHKVKMYYLNHPALKRLELLN